MKKYRLILAAFAAMAFVNTASAQTEVLITGSTAFRSQTHTAIKNMLDVGFTYGSTGSALGGTSATGTPKVSQSIFVGTANTTGHPSVVIKCSWTGSAAGVQTVEGSLPVNFLNQADIRDETSGNIVALTSGATGTVNLKPGTQALTPDACFSDAFQSSTEFRTNTLTDFKVGVVGFKIVASNGAPAGLTNVTSQQLKSLFANGHMALSCFTGSASDNTTYVYAVGRDQDSGTRITGLAETGVGALGSVFHNQPQITSSVVTGTGTDPFSATSYVAYPDVVVNGITYFSPTGGYSTGGELATVMRAATNATTGYSITYLSSGDGTTATTGSANPAGDGAAKQLTFNGVAFSNTAIQEGTYTLWGYEHLMYRPSLTGVKFTVIDTLLKPAVIGSVTPSLSSMKVSRASDGGNVGFIE